MDMMNEMPKCVSEHPEDQGKHEEAKDKVSLDCKAPQTLYLQATPQHSNEALEHGKLLPPRNVHPLPARTEEINLKESGRKEMGVEEEKDKDKDKEKENKKDKDKDKDKNKEECQEQEKPERGAGRWTEEEHQRLLDALKKYGNQWTKVRAYVRTRSTIQIRSHAQKHFNKLRLRALRKIMDDPSQPKKLFVITREYLNRTPIPKTELEVPDLAITRRARLLDRLKRSHQSQLEPQGQGQSKAQALSPAQSDFHTQLQFKPPSQSQPEVPPTSTPAIPSLPQQPGQVAEAPALVSNIVPPDVTPPTLYAVPAPGFVYWPGPNLAPGMGYNLNSNYNISLNQPMYFYPPPPPVPPYFYPRPNASL